MRFSSKSIVFFCLAGSLALASPIAKKFEKKSAEGIDSKAILGAEGTGANADRAKKQASTTFCVEIKHDKPVQVDCNQAQPMVVPVVPQQVYVQPPPQQVIVQPTPEPTPEPVTEPPTTTPAPTPAPAPPQPQVIVMPQQPAPQQQVVYQQPPPQVVYQQQPQVVYQQQPQVVYQQPQQPCEPEMQAYSYQPPPQVYYAPTGNCATHGQAAPVHIQTTAPTANPVQQLIQQKIQHLQNIHDKLGPQKPAVYGQQLPVYQQQQQQPLYQHPQQQQRSQAIEPLLAALSQHSGSPYVYPSHGNEMFLSPNNGQFLMTPIRAENFRESFYQNPMFQSYRFSRDDREKSKPVEMTTQSTTTAELEDEKFREVTEASEEIGEKSRLTRFLSDADISEEEQLSVQEPNHEEEELTL